MPDDRNYRRVARMFGGMLIGFPIAWLLARTGAIYEVATWAPDEIASTILAGLLLMIALITGGFATSKRGYRALTDEGLGEPVERETLAMLRGQALVTALCAVLLLIPPIAMHTGYAGTGVLVLIAAVLLAMTWLNFRLTRQSDELTRAVNAEASAWTLGIGFLLLFGWSALEKMALAPAVNSWTLLTISTVLAFLVWTVVSVRRGLVGSAGR